MGRRAKTLVILLGIFAVCILIYLFMPKPYLPEGEFPSLRVPVESEVVEEWQEYCPPSNRFKVTIPIVPQHASERIPMKESNELIRYDVYVARSRRGTTFIINIIEYPPSFDTTNAHVLLSDVIKEMTAANAANQLTQSDQGTFLGYPSADFLLTNPDGRIHVRAFLKDKTLYVLSVADRDQQVLDTSFTKFVGSFQIGPSD